MTDLAKLVVRLEAETAKYQSELEKAKRQLSGFEKTANAAVKNIAVAVGAAAVAAAVGVAALTKAAIDSADHLNDLAKSTGVSVEALSQLEYAAQRSGTDLETLTTGLRKLASTSFDAAKGLKGPAETFKMLGISAVDSSGKLKSTQELLLDISDVFSRYEDGAAKAALAQDLFGRSGTQLIPFLNEGRSGIEALMKRFDELGGTVSTKTAVAADEFNDRLKDMEVVLGSVGKNIAADLLPSLNSLAEHFSETAEKSELLESFARSAANVLRGLATVGLGTATAFQKLGNALGAAAAAAAQSAQGNFHEAAQIWRMATADNLRLETEYQRLRADIWKEGGDEVLREVQITAKRIKDTFNLAKGVESPLQEIKITAKKVESNAIDDINKELLKQTQTQLDAQVSAYNADKAALDDLLAQKLISVEQYNERISESFDKVFDFEPTVKKIKESTEKVTNQITEFEKEAARNTQDIIANALVNGFEGGAKGILKSFGQMLVELAAQAVAANIAKMIFGNPGATGDTGGWIGLAANFIAGFADGGRPPVGKPSIIGERGPEMWVPDSAGTVVPAGEWGGGMQISNTFVIQTPTGRVPLETQQQVATRAAQSLEQARRRNS